MLLIRLGLGKFERVLIHRYITDTPREDLVDHINRNTLDNRLSNLRLLSHAENMQNRNLQKNNSTGVRGVTIRPNGKYFARVRLKRKVVFYEQFDTIEEATIAVGTARRKFLPFSNECEANLQ
ncbi:HNH endonuclease [Paenibacillus sp. SI8]|uniref:HNH endonuclease n=1 Tax=unclassified Paenibacillus TaxID=185978 RepID=UPI003465BF43